VVAIVAYGMPVGQGLLSASEGAVFGFFPILWIVINAIWIYNMTVARGTSRCCAGRSAGSPTTSASRR
jgi:lactate permease